MQCANGFSVTPSSLNRSFTIRHAVNLPLYDAIIVHKVSCDFRERHSNSVYTSHVQVSGLAATYVLADIMKALSANPRRNLHTAYSINVLSKYSSLISHRPSIFEGRHIDHRSSKVDTSITDFRRSTRRSSIFEGQHIDLRRLTHRDIDRRSSKGDASIFESRHIDLRKSTHRFSKIEGRNITPTIRHRILSTTALQVLRVGEVTHAHIYVYIYIHV